MSTKTTRRSVLSGAAALPALSIPAIAVTTIAPDPIFAAIEQHRRASAEFDQAISNNSNLEDQLPKEKRCTSIRSWETKIVETDDPKWIAAERAVHFLSDAETTAACALVDTKPTTLAGAIALLKYAGEVVEKGCEWPTSLVESDDNKTASVHRWEFWLHRNLAEALSDMAAA